jgi:cell division protease FtsH
VGVGSSRIRELFELARQSAPVIIFIDEIDALGRARSGNGEMSGAERDNTLNELLVAMDGFKNNSGIFVIGATNRADLLDPALLRPGRIDKRIYIGNPDSVTREAILRIHTKGKPYCAKISISDLVDMTAGLSGAQIENLMNEAMINALRCNREVISSDDIDLIMNKMMVGWQPIEHKFSSDMIDQIAIHELGHATLGLLSKHHSKMTKVVINLSSPKSPAYTVFEPYSSPLYTREALFEHLTILLGGRIAEEVFYNVSITTGAINDFEEALKLAEKMVVYYGMGNKIIYPSTSEKYKAKIDDEVARLIGAAYSDALYILQNSKDFILEAVEILKRDNIVRVDVLDNMIHRKYRNLLQLKNNEK